MAGIVRSITHWTGGGGRASALDKKHYHRITEYDGTVVEGNEEIADNIVTADDDYAAHTLNLNTGSAGFSMAGMAGAIESPFSAGSAPINERQFEAHCRMLADFHASMAIPVTRETCLTHAEVEPTLGVKQRGKWDLTRLPFKLELRGAIPVGDYMRERVKSYMPASPVTEIATNRPILREGARGAFVLDLQILLADAHVFSGKRDGQFGPLTKAAVAAFQTRNGLKADGVVGPLTWAALMEPAILPERDVSLDDLRERGSQTIKSADLAQNAILGGTGVAAIGSTLEALTSASEKATGAAGQLEGLLGMGTSLIRLYWPLLLALGLGAVVWYALARVKRARLEDARTGANLKR